MVSNCLFALRFWKPRCYLRTYGLRIDVRGLSLGLFAAVAAQNYPLSQPRAAEVCPSRLWGETMFPSLIKALMYGWVAPTVLLKHFVALEAMYEYAEPERQDS